MTREEPSIVTTVPPRIMMSARPAESAVVGSQLSPTQRIRVATKMYFLKWSPSKYEQVRESVPSELA